MARVFSHPQLRGGEPCIKGTRIPVSMIVASVAEGMSRREILDEYPRLQDEAEYHPDVDENHPCLGQREKLLLARFLAR
ncbi:MAG: hypothetical protein CVU64_03275 [Deltaproteobacteria bacterium HGW-Deltaproteobacteria-21]|nr:MAG: hypothetical protein CVU64_03275 [Deltaproteobacteria bacterium HGW-Deltaproteobacteria-21]